MDVTTPCAWEVYADVALQRAALEARLRRGEPPRPLAGLVIEDDEIGGLIAELPGLAATDEPALARLREETAQDLADAEEQLLQGSDTGPFSVIVWNADLDPVSVKLLALGAAIELDVARQKLVAYVNDDVSRRWLTPSAVARIVGPEAAVGLGSDAPLARACLAMLEGDTTWALRALRIESTVVATIAGAAGRDRHLPRRVEIIDSSESTGGDFVLVHGGDRRSRIERAASATAGARFFATSLPADDDSWAAVVRQCVVGGRAPIIDMGSVRTLDDDARWWLDRTTCVPIALSSEHELTLESLPERPFIEHRCDSELVDAGGGHLLDPEQARLVEKALGSVNGDPNAAVRRLVTGRLEAHAERTTPGRGWDELVLATDQIRVLRELVTRYRHRHRVFHEWGFPARPSTGATALFSGPSGTGKTMTAEIIATDLGLDLYRIDLSAVVSKFIGETEKNLEEIFTASGAGNMVLFFDEADALFGKRSEVGDAHDRYANIEVAYLLQRLERYDGFVILATNLRKNIDEAFARRIDVALDFELPDETRRRVLWAQVFPSAAPVGDIDGELLAAEFEVSGGVIRNAAVHAAFLAAEEDETIEMRHVLVGMQREYQKMGRLRSAADFERLGQTGRVSA